MIDKVNEKPELDAIGQRIRKCRKILRLQQKVMARELGISPSYFNGIELGKTIAGGEILLKLAKTYNVNVEFLVTGKGEPFHTPLNPKPIPDPIPADNKSVLKNIDTVEKLLLLMEKSSYARMSILVFATRLVNEQGNIIDRALEDSVDQHK